MSYANIIFSRFDFVLLQIILQEAKIMNQGKTVFAQIISLILEKPSAFDLGGQTRSAFPMGAESDSTYEVVFRSYTGATVHFYVDKHTGVTRMVEKVPLLDIENETGRINLFDYLKKE